MLPVKKLLSVRCVMLVLPWRGIRSASCSPAMKVFDIGLWLWSIGAATKVLFDAHIGSC